MECVQAGLVAAMLPYASLIEALRRAFSAQSDQFTAPPRHQHGLPGGDSALLIMPAWNSSLIGVKVASFFPANAPSQPSLSGFYVLMSAIDGHLVVAMDAHELTLRRTACTSALAAAFLAQRQARVLVLVGAGDVARHLAMAHCVSRPSLNRIVVWNRSRDRAERLTATLAAELPPSVHVSSDSDLETWVRQADIVSCATAATSPLVRGDWLRQGAHLDLVGSFKTSMAECDDEAVRRSKVFVDTEAAIQESGEIAGALSRGAISRAHIVAELKQLADGSVPGRSDEEEITLFKSVGCALEDLVAAQLVYEASLAGQRVDPATTLTLIDRDNPR